MLRLSLAATGLLLSAALDAGTSTTLGKASVCHPAEHVTVTVNIVSQCYPDLDSPVAATDAVASEIFAFLEARTNVCAGSRDRLIATGGTAGEFRAFYDNGTPICKNTFQKTSTIIWKTTQLNDFKANFNELQKLVYSKFHRGIQLDNVPLTFATLDEAQPGLFEETTHALEMKAEAMAKQNCIDKMKARCTPEGSCPIKGFKLVAMRTPENMAHFDYERAESAPPSGSTDPSAPIAFGDQTVSASMLCEFSYDDVYQSVG